MFEKNIPWVVIYWVFKYTGWIIDFCESSAPVDQAEMPHVSAQRLQSFPPCAANSDVGTQGVNLCHHSLFDWLVQDTTSVLDLALFYVPCTWLHLDEERGIERQGTLWNLQNLSRGIASFWCLVFLGGASGWSQSGPSILLSNKKTSRCNFNRIWRVSVCSL